MSLNRVSIGSDNGLTPNRRQAIIWTKAWLLSIKIRNFLNQNTKLFNHENVSENIVCEKAAILSRADELSIRISLSYIGYQQHEDVIKWKHFPRYWPFVRGIHWSLWIPAQRPVTRSFNVLFDLRLNKRLSKQSWGCWFETPSRPLWRHRNDLTHNYTCFFTSFLAVISSVLVD